MINYDKQSSFYSGSLPTVPRDKPDMQSHDRDIRRTIHIYGTRP